METFEFHLFIRTNATGTTVRVRRRNRRIVFILLPSSGKVNMQTKGKTNIVK